MIDTRQTNRFQMMLAVQGFVDQHQTVWSPIPIINTFKTQFDDHVLGIKEQMKSAGTDTSGMTADKNQLKENIAEKTSVISGALAAYAAVNDNQDMISNGSLQKSDVQRMRDVNLPEEMSSFIDQVRAVLDGLADFGVTEAQVTDLETSIDDFRERIGQSRIKQSAANTAKKEASSLIDDAVKLLSDKLDKVMLQFKFTNSAFYDGYTRARTILD